MDRPLELRVPATSANLGPGFGVVGLALDLWFELRVRVQGTGLAVDRPDTPADKTLDERHDPVIRGLRASAERFDIKLPDALSIELRGDAPRRSGLGSNTAEYTAGIRIACSFSRSEPSVDEMLDLLVSIGGDPAHGAATLLGGLALAVPIGAADGSSSWHALGADLDPDWWLALAAPDIALSTADAHRIVPATVPNTVVQRTAGRLVGLLQALGTGDTDLLGPCLVDEVHVPFRMSLAPGMQAAADAARAAGAAGATISGHGPTLIAFSRQRADARRSADAMTAAFAAHDLRARSIVVRPTAAF